MFGSRLIPFTHSLRTRLVVVFLILSTVPVLVTGYLVYDNGRQTIADNTVDYLATVDLLKRDAFRRWLEGGAQSLQALAQRPLVRQQIQTLVDTASGSAATSEAGTRLLVDHFQPAMDYEGTFSTLFVLDAADGHVVAATDDGVLGWSWADEDFFTRGRTWVFIEPVTYSDVYGQPAMHIATPVLDARGLPLAVLVARVNMTQVSDIMNLRSERRSTEDTYLVAADHTFLTDPRFLSGAAMHETIDTVGVDRCLEGQSGTGTYADYRGVQVLGVYEWLPDRQLCVVTEVDEAEAFAPIRALGRTLVWVAGVVIAAAIGVGLTTAWSIVRPMAQLRAGAEALGQGDLEYRIDLKRVDELGSLGRAFDTMAGALQESLEETAHGQQLLIELDRAAEAVQRARTPAEVYAAVGAGMRALGLQAVLYEKTGDQGVLRVPYITLDLERIGEAGKRAGLDLDAFRLRLSDAPTFSRVYYQQEPSYWADPGTLVTEALSAGADDAAANVAEAIGLQRTILAALVVQGQPYGILQVSGTALSERDVPAISAFANQAAIALENALLYTEVYGYAETLEARVEARTRDLEAARMEALATMEEADRARMLAEHANTVLAHEVEERQRAQEELARSNRELEQFAYIASHDLQEPLRKVQAFGDRLAHRSADAMDARSQDYLERMMAAARRGQRMINDLLSFSRVATRAQPFEQVDLQQLAGSVLDDLEVRIEQTGARVTVEQLPAIEADPSQIRQLLTNLIGNALKFHREDVAPVVEVTGRVLEAADGQICEIRVADQGIGFDTKYLDRLFKPFQRLHGRFEYEGSGIGLAICEKIVTRHGGTLTAASEPGAGAVFIVTLPLRQPTTSTG